jgi:hypothetical protein
VCAPATEVLLGQSEKLSKKFAGWVWHLLKEGLQDGSGNLPKDGVEDELWHLPTKSCWENLENCPRSLQGGSWNLLNEGSVGWSWQLPQNEWVVAPVIQC